MKEEILSYQTVLFSSLEAFTSPSYSTILVSIWCVLGASVLHMQNHAELNSMVFCMMQNHFGGLSAQGSAKTGPYLDMVSVSRDETGTI